MGKTPPSVRRMSWLIAAGLAPFYVAASLFIDPTLRLLGFSAVLVVLAVVALLLWRIRRSLVSWYCRMPLIVRGALAGCFAWCVCFSVFFVLRTNPIHLPNPFGYILGTIVSICGLLAWPVALGGWAFWWGDNPPPHPIMMSIAFNIVCGVALNAAMGAALFCMVGRSKRIRDWLK